MHRKDAILLAVRFHRRVCRRLYPAEAEWPLLVVRELDGMHAEYDPATNTIHFDSNDHAEAFDVVDSILHENVHAAGISGHGAIFRGFLEQLQGMFL